MNGTTALIYSFERKRGGGWYVIASCINKSKKLVNQFRLFTCLILKPFTMLLPTISLYLYCLGLFFAAKKDCRFQENGL